MLGEIKVGASVVAKSGGPIMLVLEVASSPGNEARVRWIDANAREQEARVSVSALEVVREKGQTQSGLLPTFFGGQPLNRRSQERRRPAARVDGGRGRLAPRRRQPLARG
jgi:uncharacterized protein YodC (DUF2158 family)